MPKKKTSQSFKIPSLSRRVIEGLSNAESLLEDGRPAEARRLLEEMDRRRPGLAPVLELLLNACYDQRDMHAYEWTCYRLGKIETDNPDLILAQAGAHMNNFRPALAIQVFEKFLRRWPGHPRASDARQTLREIRQALSMELEKLDLAEADAFDLARENEEVRFCLDHGQYPQGRLVAEKLLKRFPAFIPALNNLSQIYALQGDVEHAIQLSRQALEIEPDNVHALSNMARLLFLSGNSNEASKLAERVLQSTAPAADVYTKKAEMLSFLADDRSLLELYRQAEDAGGLKRSGVSPLFLHLVAVAHWHQGQENEARRLWKEALKLNPGFSLAQEQLDDLELPVNQRNGPYAFPLSAWVTANVVRELSKAIEVAPHRKRDSAIQAVANKFLEKHPELVALAPHMLQRGDPAGRDFVISLAGMSEHPDLLAALKEFTLSQHGTDEQRMKASRIVSEAGVLPSGPIRMWMSGEWRDVLLLNFEITAEVQRYYTHPEVARLSEEAYYALEDEEGQKAQHLLEQAIALEPDSPSLLNNLAMALEMQGQSERAQSMLHEIYARFPDYFFGVAGVARLAINGGDYEMAHTLLNRLMQRKQLHYSEFDTLCMAQIDLYLAEKNKDAARTWFEMWERPNPENPKLERYRLRLKLSDPESLFKKLTRRRK
jgi:tetratricopeptide (TPR) repeat protein